MGVWDSFARGMDIGGALTRQRDTQQQGDAFTEGGWAGVEQSAGGMGDFATAGGAHNIGRQQQQDAATAEETAIERARASVPVLSNIYSHLGSVPYEQRAQRAAELAPKAEELGIDTEAWGGMDWSDENLQREGEFAQQLMGFTDIREQGNSIIGVRPDGSMQVLWEGEPTPITSYQQAQLDTTRRGQDLALTGSRERTAATRANASARPLRGPDASLMTRVRESAEAGRGLRALASDFASNLQRQETGPVSGSAFNPNRYLDTELQAMAAAQSRMTGLMRPSGSGATSDFEQRLYSRGAPNIERTPEANQQIIAGIERLGQIADARQFFYEDYAEANGSLNGAERAFQQSEEFLAMTGNSDDKDEKDVDFGDSDQPPDGVTPEEWSVMTPEERALWQN